MLPAHVERVLRRNPTPELLREAWRAGELTACEMYDCLAVLERDRLHAEHADREEEKRRIALEADQRRLRRLKKRAPGYRLGADFKIRTGWGQLPGYYWYEPR